VAVAIGPYVAVVDYMMPGMSGFETATRIKAVRAECTVVIFSALVDLEAKALAQPDVDFFVPKNRILDLDTLLSDMRSARNAGE
jgi:DNA-binding NarL/FixJ family response regulator